MRWVFAPLATLIAVAVAYALFHEERANPLEPYFDAEDTDFLAHLPHPWSRTT